MPIFILACRFPSFFIRLASTLCVAPVDMIDVIGRFVGAVGAAVITVKATCPAIVALRPVRTLGFATVVSRRI